MILCNTSEGLLEAKFQGSEQSYQTLDSKTCTKLQYGYKYVYVYTHVHDTVFDRQRMSFPK